MPTEIIEINNDLIRRLIKELRPIDDAFMRAMLQDDIPLVELILRIILNKDDLIVTEIETQRDLNKLAGGRSICLDAYATDSENKKYDIEIQRSDYGADAHRARYHLGALDTENLKSGEDFKDLPDTYVIFITENDIIGKGKPIHIFERYDRTNDEKLNDGSYIIYVNGQYRGDDNLGRLMHDFFCAVPEDMYFKEMSERAKQFKEFRKENNDMNPAVDRIIGEELERNPNPTGLLKQVKDRLMKQAQEEARAAIIAEGIEKGRAEGIEKGRAEGIEKGRAEGIEKGRAEGIEKGRAEGIEKGRAEEKRNTAEKMLAAGTFTSEQVSEFSGLSVSEVEELKADSNK